MNNITAAQVAQEPRRTLVLMVDPPLSIRFLEAMCPMDAMVSAPRSDPRLRYGFISEGKVSPRIDAGLYLVAVGGENVARGSITRYPLQGSRSDYQAVEQPESRAVAGTAMVIVSPLFGCVFYQPHSRKGR